MVEFALVLPITLLLVIGVLDIGKAVNYWIDETHLANTGARFAVVDRNPGEPDLTLQQYIKSIAETDDLQAASQVCINFPIDGTDGSSGEVGDPVEVEVTYPYNWLPFIDEKFVTPVTIKSTATMRIEATPSAYDDGCA